MENAYRHNGDGVCRMCGAWARERWHTVLECAVVLRLWERWGGVFVALGRGVVGRREMGLGFEGTGGGVSLSNRLGFLMRSSVMSMRGVESPGPDEAVDRIWSLFLRRTRKEMVEEWYVAKMEGQMERYEREWLIGGVLGTLVDGTIRWSGVFAGVRHQWWCLFD